MKSLHTLQLVLEVFVLAGYAMALIPFGYLFVFWWVIPLTLVNLVLSAVSFNKNLPYTIPNFIMALLSLIPVIGYLFRIVGIILSILAIVKLTNGTKN